MTRAASSGPTARAAAPTATASVADALARVILGEMSPGDSLPSEGSLAERFAVSRLTVREAVKMLAGRGLLDVGRGRRAMVVEPTGIAFSDYLFTVIQRDPKGLYDLIELRLSLEVQSATLAAKRVTRAGLVAMEAAMQGMREAAADYASGTDVEAAEWRFHEHDVSFHEAIALSSGNRLVSYLFEAMAAPLRRTFNLSRSGHTARGGTLEDIISAHSAILDAIREGNGKAAGAAMWSHLDATEGDIQAALRTGVVAPLRAE